MSELFKYRPENGPFSFDILENYRIHFCAPKEFNDPFDSAIPFDYSDVSAEYMKKAVKRYSGERGSNRKIRREEEKILLRGMKKSRDQFGTFGYKNQMAFINQTVGVFCLSSFHDDLIMWAHYANSHRGFCIGFHKQQIVDQAVRESLLMPSFAKSMIELRKVEYSHDYPIVNPETLGDLDKFYIPLTTKSKHWEYEKEYRLIYTNGVGKYLEFGEGMVSRVVLGVNSALETEKRVKGILKRKKERIPLFKAKMKNRKYALEFSPISY